VLLDHRDLKEILVLRDQLDHKALRDLKALKVPLVLLGHKALLDQLVCQVTQL
jgi:hypothetical protein